LRENSRDRPAKFFESRGARPNFMAGMISKWH